MRMIHFIRHGQTEWNKEGRLQGWLNSDLTALGRKQAAELAGRYEVDAVFCSDLGRAMQTARLAFPGHEPVCLAELREIYLGEWQGRTYEELANNEQFVMYCDRPTDFRGATQESFQQVTQRMRAALEQILATNMQRVAVVGHGVALHCLWLYIQRQPLSSFSHGDMLASCGVITQIFTEAEK